MIQAIWKLLLSIFIQVFLRWCFFWEKQCSISINLPERWIYTEVHRVSVIAQINVSFEQFSFQRKHLLMKSCTKKRWSSRKRYVIPSLWKCSLIYYQLLYSPRRICWPNINDVLHLVSYLWIITQNLTRVSNAENIGQSDPTISCSCITPKDASID